MIDSAEHILIFPGRIAQTEPQRIRSTGIPFREENRFRSAGCKDIKPFHETFGQIFNVIRLSMRLSSVSFMHPDNNGRAINKL